MTINNNNNGDRLSKELFLAKNKVMELNYQKIKKRFNLDTVNRRFSAALVVEVLALFISLLLVPKTVILIMLAVFGITDICFLDVKSKIKDEIRNIDSNIISYNAIIAGLMEKIEKENELEKTEDNDTMTKAVKDTMELLEHMQDEEINPQKESTSKIRKLEKK